VSAGSGPGAHDRHGKISPVAFLRLHEFFAVRFAHLSGPTRLPNSWPIRFRAPTALIEVNEREWIPAFEKEFSLYVPTVRLFQLTARLHPLLRPDRRIALAH